MTLQDYNHAKSLASKMFDYFLYNKGNYPDNEFVDYPEMSKLFIDFNKSQRGYAVKKATKKIYNNMSN